MARKPAPVSGVYDRIPGDDIWSARIRVNGKLVRKSFGRGPKGRADAIAWVEKARTIKRTGEGVFPGQIGSYTTKPAYGPGVVTPVFPSSSGFALSGQVFANHESPFFANGNASDPGNFFQTIHAHGYGENSSYMNKVMDHTDPKSGRLIHGSYSLVGGCL